MTDVISAVDLVRIVQFLDEGGDEEDIELVRVEDNLLKPILRSKSDA